LVRFLRKQKKIAYKIYWRLFRNRVQVIRKIKGNYCFILGLTKFRRKRRSVYKYKFIYNAKQSVMVSPILGVTKRKVLVQHALIKSLKHYKSWNYIKFGSQNYLNKRKYKLDYLLKKRWYKGYCCFKE